MLSVETDDESCIPNEEPSSQTNPNKDLDVRQINPDNFEGRIFSCRSSTNFFDSAFISKVRTCIYKPDGKWYQHVNTQLVVIQSSEACAMNRGTLN